MKSSVPEAIPNVMCAVLLTGHGGLDKLEYRTDVAVPHAGHGEVLIRVGGAGVNNTDINTRIGWYAKTVTVATDSSATLPSVDNGSWSGTPLTFPRIQGADVCGRIVGVGDGVSPHRVGERVIVATMQQDPSGVAFSTVTMGSEMDGGFAQFVVTRATETHAVRCNWTDVEHARSGLGGGAGPGADHRCVGWCGIGGRATGETTGCACDCGGVIRKDRGRDRSRR